MRSERMKFLSFLCESLRWLPSSCWSSTLRCLRRGLSPGGRRPTQVLIWLDAVGRERMHPFPMPGEILQVASIQQLTSQTHNRRLAPRRRYPPQVQRVPIHCLADSGTGHPFHGEDERAAVKNRPVAAFTTAPYRPMNRESILFFEQRGDRSPENGRYFPFTKELTCFQEYSEASRI